MEGGSANDYDYAGGDPCNNYDLDGSQTVKAPRPFKEERLAGPCNRGSSSYTKTYKFTQPKVVWATYRGRRDLSSGEEYLWRSTFRHYGYAGARAVTSCEEGYLVRRHYYDRPIHRDVYYYQWILTVSGPSYGKWKKGH